MEKQFSATGAISMGWDYACKNWLMILGISIVSYIVGEMISSIGSMGAMTSYMQMVETIKDGGQVDPTPMLLSMAASPMMYVSKIVQWAIAAGLTALYFLALDGKPLTFDAYNMPFQKYLHFIIAEVLTGLIVAVGLVFCILPGIYLAVRLAFTEYYVIDEGCTFDEAIKKSWRTSSTQTWHLLVAFILIKLVRVSGILLCCVGVFFTRIIGDFALMIIYRVLKEQTAATVAPSVEEPASTSETQE